MSSSPVIDHEASQQRYGARYADGYDDRRFTTTEGSFAQAFELDLFTRVLRDNKARRVLDMPIGTGRVAIPLADQFEFVGGDISPAMIAEGKARAEAAGVHNIVWMECSVDKLPFPDGEFDAVVTARLFQHVPKDMAHEIICELSRVVKPGGVVILQFRSGLYGLFLKFGRYYLSKRTGNIRHKCIFPDQVSKLFAGHKIVGHYGYKFPISGRLASIIGTPAMLRVERVLARTPGLRWFGKYKTFVLTRQPIA
jgi:ubiquinone/menaquinone biosynthesis C-methylase UbiE